MKRQPILQERSDLDQCHGVYVSLQELTALRAVAGALNPPYRQRSSNALAGGHHSLFRGRGIDFDEVRQYQPGDDIRSVDWRVTARTGKPHTKLFREERERPLYLLIDQSQSLFFGSQQAFKSVVAARISALLAWHGLQQGDRIGAMVFSDTHHHELRPQGGQRGVQHVFRTLIDYNHALNNQAPPTDPSHPALTQALSRLSRVVKPGSAVFIISDFQGFDDSAWHPMSLLRRHNDVIALQVYYDPLEQTLPPAGRYAFSDGQQRLALNTANASLRTAYQHHHQQQQSALEAQLARLALPLLRVSTHDDIVEQLRISLGPKRSMKAIRHD